VCGLWPQITARERPSHVELELARLVFFFFFFAAAFAPGQGPAPRLTLGSSHPKGGIPQANSRIRGLGRGHRAVPKLISRRGGRNGTILDGLGERTKTFCPCRRVGADTKGTVTGALRLPLDPRRPAGACARGGGVGSGRDRSRISPKRRLSLAQRARDQRSATARMAWRGDAGENMCSGVARLENCHAPIEPTLAANYGALGRGGAKGVRPSAHFGMYARDFLAAGEGLSRMKGAGGGLTHEYYTPLIGRGARAVSLRSTSRIFSSKAALLRRSGEGDEGSACVVSGWTRRAEPGRNPTPTTLLCSPVFSGPRRAVRPHRPRSGYGATALGEGRDRGLAYRVPGGRTSPREDGNLAGGGKFAVVVSGRRLEAEPPVESGANSGGAAAGEEMPGGAGHFSTTFRRQAKRGHDCKGKWPLPLRCEAGVPFGRKLSSRIRGPKPIVLFRFFYKNERVDFFFDSPQRLPAACFRKKDMRCGLSLYGSKKPLARMIPRLVRAGREFRPAPKRGPGTPNGC